MIEIVIIKYFRINLWLRVRIAISFSWILHQMTRKTLTNPSNYKMKKKKSLFTVSPIILYWERFVHVLCINRCLSLIICSICFKTGWSKAKKLDLANLPLAIFVLSFHFWIEAFRNVAPSLNRFSRILGYSDNFRLLIFPESRLDGASSSPLKSLKEIFHLRMHRTESVLLRIRLFVNLPRGRELRTLLPQDVLQS